MIPQFPIFKKLELSDCDEVEIYTREYLPYAEFQFSTMICWEIHKPLQLSVLNNNLLIKQTNCLNGEYFLSLLGTTLLTETLREIAYFLHQNNLPIQLACIPEEMVKSLDEKNVQITEDRDNFDYVYAVSDLLHAKGNKYKIYRHKRSGFIKTYSGINIEHIDLKDVSIKQQVVALFDTWKTNKEEKGREAESVIEFRALARLLSCAHEFNNLKAFGVFDHGEMIAFSINEINPDKYMTGLFWKANTQYKGIYQFLMNEIVTFSSEAGIEYLNWESDLGIKSLCDSKLALNPANFLKKFVIDLRGFSE